MPDTPTRAVDPDGPDPQRVLDSLEQFLALSVGYGNGNSAVLEAQAEARRLLAQAGR